MASDTNDKDEPTARQWRMKCAALESALIEAESFIGRIKVGATPQKRDAVLAVIRRAQDYSAPEAPQSNGATQDSTAEKVRGSRPSPDVAPPESLGASPAEDDFTLIAFEAWWLRHGMFSIARHYGGIKLNGASYTYIPEHDECIRDDVLKLVTKLRRKPKGKG